MWVSQGRGKRDSGRQQEVAFRRARLGPLRCIKEVSKGC